MTQRTIEAVRQGEERRVEGDRAAAEGAHVAPGADHAAPVVALPAVGASPATPASEPGEDAELLRFVARLFGDGCYTVSELRSPGRGIVHASPAFARFSGYGEDEVRGRDLGFLQRDDGDQDANAELRAALRDGRPCTVVVRNYRRDGTLIFNEQHHYPLRDAEGRATHLVTIHRDVSERVHALGAVDAGQELGRREGGGIFGYSVLLRPDAEPELLWIGAAAAHLTGHPPERLRTEGPDVWVHPDDREAFGEALLLRRSTRSHRLRYRLVTSDGRVRWVEDHGRRSWEAREAQAVAVHAVVRDVTTERRSSGELWQIEAVDALTGLPAAQAFRERVAQAVAAARAVGAGAAVALVDLDAFSFVNETIGRGQGDRLLQEVANRLRRASGRTDVLARLGGDRFGLLLGDVEGPETLLPRLRALHAVLDEPVRWRCGEMRLSATLGLARLGGDAEGDEGGPLAEEVERLLDRADRALQYAKGHERGRWRLAGTPDHARLRARESTESELRRALEEDELLLHYQPRVDLRGGRLAGVEALVRWLHPERGLLKPHAFLPSLEAASMDPALFRWVLPRALAQAAAWRAAGRPCRVAVNVGRQTLEHPDFERWVRDELQRLDLNPALLELELTEGTPMEVFERHVRTLSSLRASGVQVSLDDFGVATASLSQLQQLPLDGLKIDKRFVDKLVAGSRGDLEMVRAIIAIGKSMDLTVVAEGVETHAQREVLEDLRCDEGQGYLYSQAVPADFVPVDAPTFPRRGVRA